MVAAIAILLVYTNVPSYVCVCVYVHVCVCMCVCVCASEMYRTATDSRTPQEIVCFWTSLSGDILGRSVAILDITVGVQDCSRLSRDLLESV